MQVRLVITSFFALFILGACQTSGTRLDPEQTALKNHPNSTRADADIGNTYLWGGEIISTENLETTTELTIISYPLDSNENPKYKGSSVGRFIAVYPGFLEPTDYKPGNLVSMTGKLAEYRDGKVAQANYSYPVLIVDNLKLHGKPFRYQNLPFSIGIGIGIYD